MPKNNHLVGRIPRGAEHRQGRVAHQRHEMSSEWSQKSYKYWNLQAVVMSDYSLIATRNSHAKHNKSVDRIPEHRQTRVAHQRHKMRSEKDFFVQILQLTCCSHVGLFVDSHPTFTCQTQSISGSHTWAPTSRRLLRKGLQTIIFRQRNQGSKLVKSYRLHKHTRWIKSQKYIKNMPENNQTTIYALSTDKASCTSKTWNG